MENTIHAQKVAILSRLIKESSLTLEEALLLLKEDETVVEKSVTPYNGKTNFPIYPSSPGYWGITPSVGTGTILCSPGVGTTTTNITAGTGLTFSYNNAQEALTKLFGDPQTD